jgi:hypothetical protein
MDTTTKGLMRAAIEPNRTTYKSYTGMHQVELGRDAAWSTTSRWRCTTPKAIWHHILYFRRGKLLCGGWSLGRSNEGRMSAENIRKKGFTRWARGMR